MRPAEGAPYGATRLVVVAPHPMRHDAEARQTYVGWSKLWAKNNWRILHEERDKVRARENVQGMHCECNVRKRKPTYLDAMRTFSFPRSTLHG